MGADVTFSQMTYLDERCGKMFGLEPTAIIFSLPWALLMWSYVISAFWEFTLTGIYACSPPPNRLVTFSVALLLFGFVVSNNWTRIIVAVTSAPVVALTVGCIWATWESGNDRGVWLDGFQPSIVRALQFEHLPSFVLRVIDPLRNRPTSRGPDDASGVRVSAGPQGDGDGV